MLFTTSAKSRFASRPAMAAGIADHAWSVRDSPIVTSGVQGNPPRPGIPSNILVGAMRPSQQFRLTAPVLCIEKTGDLRGAVEVPAYGVVTVVEDPGTIRMGIPIRWEDHLLFMFTRDLQKYGVAVRKSSRRGSI